MDTRKECKARSILNKFKEMETKALNGEPLDDGNFPGFFKSKDSKLLIFTDAVKLQKKTIISTSKIDRSIVSKSSLSLSFFDATTIITFFKSNASKNVHFYSFFGARPFRQLATISINKNLGPKSL
jgi:hypothetical protein